MDDNENKPKCRSCNTTLVLSRKHMASTTMYWNRPWGSTFKMSVPLISYACMECGRIYLYFRDINKNIREFNKLPKDLKQKIFEE